MQANACPVYVNGHAIVDHCSRLEWAFSHNKTRLETPAWAWKLYIKESWHVK